MQKKLSKQNNSAFTLSEVLIAVAILIVLMGLAMIPITRHQRDLRQTELDAKAEIVYHAAQNKLSELLANGRISDCYAEDLQPLNNTPLDAAERKTSLHYVTSATKTGEGSAAAAILPKDQVDRQLWDNHWVIELDPASGSATKKTDVFYTDADGLMKTPEKLPLGRYLIEELQGPEGYYNDPAYSVEFEICLLYTSPSPRDTR